MKNKNLLIIFLYLLLITTFVWPEKAEAGIFGWVKSAVGGLKNWVTDKIVQGIAALIYLIFQVIHLLIWWITYYLIAPIVDFLAKLNPFDDTSEKSPIKIIWNVFRNLAYIIIVFSALAAGFEWLMSQEASAKRLIFNIIIVALIINFTFVLIKEAFGIVKEIEKELTGGQSEKVGSLIAASLWQKDPLKEIMNISQELEGTDGGEILKLLAQFVGYVFIIVVDIVIFIILIVVGFLFVVRYIMIIFLTGVSPIAVASATFPEFRGLPGLNTVFSGFRFFGSWLSSLVSWTLVVPIFIILVILGNVVNNNVLEQSEVRTMDDLFQFFITLFILIGWYIVSLVVTRRITKGVSKFAEAVATGILLAIGAIGAGLALRFGGGAIGTTLRKAGETVVEKTPTTRFTGWVGGLGQRMQNIGQQMVERRYKSEADLAGAKMNLYRERLARETDERKIAVTTTNMANLLQKFKNNPYVLGTITNQIDKMSKKDFDKIATNTDAISALLNPDLPDEAIEKIRKKVTDLPDKTKLKILTDENLLSIYQQSAKIKADFLEEISKIESDKMIEALGQAKSETIQQITKDSELQNAINKSTKGLYSALVKGEVKAVANSLLNIGEDAFKKFGHIQSIARQVNPEINLDASLQEAFIVDPLPILKAAVKSTDPTLINSLKQIYPDRQSAISALNAREGTDLYRLINQIWSPIEVARR